MRRFTLITIIVLIVLLAIAAVQAILFVSRTGEPRPGVTPPTPTQT